MFPALDVEYFFEAEEFDFDLIFEDEGTAENKSINSLTFQLALIGVALVALMILLGKRRWKKPLKNKNSHELSSDLQGVLKVLDKNGGRMTQKELRKNFELSEANISLMITELESLGLVKRIKKGRGNIIIREFRASRKLPEDHPQLRRRS
jgi:uncharacterized membrane protein